MPGTILLSYHRTDIDKVSRLRDRLADAGYSVRMGTESVVGSQHWVQGTADRVCDSSVILFCVTRAWEDKDAAIYSELKLALEVEKRLGTGHEIVVPVLLEGCTMPEPLRPRPWVDYSLGDESGFHELVKAVSTALERARQDRCPVTPRFRNGCRVYFEHLCQARQDRFLSQCEILSTALLGAAVLEIGLLQEWAPPSQHPGGFPGWGTWQSMSAVGCSLVAAVVAAVCNQHFFRLVRQRAESLSQNKRQFYGLGMRMTALAFAASLLLLAVSTHQIPREGARLSRLGVFQVVKALVVTYAEMFFLVWPGWFVALWVKRGFLYRRPAVTASQANSVALIAIIAIVVMGSLQWQAWKDPLEVGYGDPWRTAHMLIQAVLMVALACCAWWTLVTAEDLEERARDLELSWGDVLKP